jgi:hypothetical protein
MFHKWFGIVVFAFAGSYAFAGPTGLNLLPISDVLGHLEIYMEYNLTLNERNKDQTAYHCMALEVGLWDRVELGIDLGLDPKTSETWNAKVRLFQSKDDAFALSAGLWNCAEDYVEPYLTGSYRLGDSRLHLGVTHDQTTRLMAGSETCITKHLCAYTDYISGPNEQLWFGAGYCHPKIQGLLLGVSLKIPLSKDQGFQSVLKLGYTTHF